MLLWHGSAVTNFLGILTQGLKIAPPEAPATGYMFGKGLYFADHFAKSFSYCSAAPKTNYFILLAEVVLGKSLEKFEADYITKLPNGYLSLKGIGREGPDMPQSVVLDSGIRVPCGPLKKFEAPEDVYVSLSFNEYIVYDVSQVRIRYMVELTD
jgi:poly [ADP-ribose] polymerase